MPAHGQIRSDAPRNDSAALGAVAAVPRVAPPSESIIRNPKPNIVLLGALLVLAIVLAYRPAWRAGFIWDDDDYVTHNELLTAPDGLRRIWFSTDAPSQYFPLTYTVLRAEHALWGLAPAGYHWVNLLLHAANALLVWRLLARLRIPAAWLGAAVFALHPVQVESVAWVTELKNVLSLFFLLLALRAWVEFTDGRASWRFYAAALLCHALALAAKTTACTLPAALLLVLWLRGQPITRARLAQAAPFLGLGLAMGLLTLWWERTQQGTDGGAFALGLPERALIAGRAVWFYLGKFLWPADLAFSYPRWTVDPSDPLAYGWLAAGAGLCAVIAGVRRFTGRGLESAAVFYVAMLSPLLGFIMLYTFRYAFVADHYQYVALLAPAALVAAVLHRVFVSAPVTRTVLSAALVLGLGAATWRQSRIYENRETLWRATLAVNPGSFLAHNNLSAELLGQGRVEEAVAHARAALSLGPAGPDLALVQINLGNAALRQNRPEEAVAHYRAAVAAQPDFAEAHDNLGRALLDLERTDEAIAAFRAALALQPAHANAHRNLGDALYRIGRRAEACAHYERAAAARPDDAALQNNLGSALLDTGRTAEAQARFETALRLAPGFVPAHRNLGVLLLQLGRAADAAAQFRAVLAAQPDDVRTLAALAVLLATAPDAAIRRRAESLTLAQRAHELTGGDDPLALHALAAAYAEAGRFPEAVSAAERALQRTDASANAAFAALLETQIRSYAAGTPLRLGP